MRTSIGLGLFSAAAAQDLFLAFKNVSVADSCNAFKQNADNCANCGSCKNPGARPGVLCKGKSTGYFCPPEWAQGQDMSFACMDWTFGSVGMKSAEEAFNQKHGDNVRFGVGTFGTSADPHRGLGNCYRLKVDGMDKDLLLQSINTGSDVAGSQFDMQIGAGGAGAFNTCAGGKHPGEDSMYPGSYDKSNWGNVYGGVDNRAQCKNLPIYPAAGDAMRAAGDDLVTLCEYGFEHGARQEGGGNPSIKSIGRVKCPDELVHMTQLQRSDDPASYECGDSCVQASHECLLNSGGQSAEWCLTRMMDCRKPSGAFVDNTGTTTAGHRIVQTCTSDGYTRQDVRCGCTDCYC